jgi:hypothetical protein
MRIGFQPCFSQEAAGLIPFKAKTKEAGGTGPDDGRRVPFSGTFRFSSSPRPEIEMRVQDRRWLALMLLSGVLGLSGYAALQAEK